MRSFVESHGGQYKHGSLEQLTFPCAPPKMYPEQQVRSAPTPPYKGAPGYKCSVYYYWWRYLQLSTDYRATCNQGGIGVCSNLYDDFGNIYDTSFAEWWEQHWHLFVEPPAAVIASDNAVFDDDADILTIKLDRSRGPEAVKRALDAIHRQIHYPERSATKPKSAADYPVFTRPILMTLHRQLQVYKLKTQLPEATDAEIADWVGVTVSNKLNGMTERQLLKAGIPTDQLRANMRRAKNRVVQRDYRMACSMIENAAKGVFPKSDTR